MTALVLIRANKSRGGGFWPDVRDDAGRVVGRTITVSGSLLRRRMATKAPIFV